MTTVETLRCLFCGSSNSDKLVTRSQRSSENIKESLRLFQEIGTKDHI